mmetsp:Transcript_5973/g.15184  ORF Transcript_5973/g.15184 Transcript_5973/m.15184 type:complete len:640 (-) Transcript_5973:259-2178(-)
MADDESFHVDSTKQPVAVAFQNLRFQVEIPDPDAPKAGTCGSQPKITKTILHDLTGAFLPGKFTAIMGASGAGKTTMLNTVAGEAADGEIYGRILLNGREVESKVIKRWSSFVFQDDVIMTTSTVRECITLSARLRLPSSLTRAQIYKRVDQVISILHLEKCAETIVGSPQDKGGISGGERKRCAIGMELVTNPPVLFLDEPTTGLDATTSSSVLALLRRLADHGRTIVLSIHQPRFKIFEMFDTLTLLSDGNIVYHGETQQVVPYFRSIGYSCSDFNNPADYILDVVSGEEPKEGEKEAPTECDDQEEKKQRVKACQDNLVAQYKSSQLAASAEAAYEREAANAHLNAGNLNYRGTYAASWGHQVMTCSKRAFLNVVRNPATSVGQVLVNMIVGVVTGVIFLRVDLQTDIQRTIRDRTGALFFIAVNLMFSNMGAIEIFLKERVIFVHEKAAGYYSVSAYYVSKLLCDMIPVRVIPTAFFSVVVYFMIGLQQTPEKFFWFLLTAELQNVCAASVCFLFSSLISVFAVANLAVTMYYVLMMILSGLLVSVNAWPDGTRWIGYLSFTKYSYELFVENEFTGLTFDCAGNGDPCTGEEVLAPNILNVPTGNRGIKVMALCIYIAGMLILGYLALVRLKKRS